MKRTEMEGEKEEEREKRPSAGFVYFLSVLLQVFIKTPN
jgi:hypothetical protein